MSRTFPRLYNQAWVEAQATEPVRDWQGIAEKAAEGGRVPSVATVKRAFMRFGLPLYPLLRDEQWMGDQWAERERTGLPLREIGLRVGGASTQTVMNAAERLGLPTERVSPRLPKNMWRFVRALLPGRILKPEFRDGDRFLDWLSEALGDYAASHEVEPRVLGAARLLVVLKEKKAVAEVLGATDRYWITPEYRLAGRAMQLLALVADARREEVSEAGPFVIHGRVAREIWGDDARGVSVSLPDLMDALLQEADLPMHQKVAALWRILGRGDLREAWKAALDEVKRVLADLQ